MLPQHSFYLVQFYQKPDFILSSVTSDKIFISLWKHVQVYPKTGLALKELKPCCKFLQSDFFTQDLILKFGINPFHLRNLVKNLHFSFYRIHKITCDSLISYLFGHLNILFQIKIHLQRLPTLRYGNLYLYITTKNLNSKLLWRTFDHQENLKELSVFQKTGCVAKKQGTINFQERLVKTFVKFPLQDFPKSLNKSLGGAKHSSCAAQQFWRQCALGRWTDQNATLVLLLFTPLILP